MCSGIFEGPASTNLSIEVMRRVKKDSRYLLIQIGLEIERIESQYLGLLSCMKEELYRGDRRSKPQSHY